MKKMPSLFRYDPATLVRGPRPKEAGARYDLGKVTPGCEWVLAGEGVASEKVDGTACLVRNYRLYKRHDAKHGKTPPPGWEPCQPEPDPTGHWPGWLEVLPEDPASWMHLEAWKTYKGTLNHVPPEPEHTVELIGEKVNSNAYKMVGHVLWRHGRALTNSVRDLGAGGIDEALKTIGRARTIGLISTFLERHEVEGLVFRRKDEMVKVTRVGLGLPWPPAREGK